MVSKRLALLLSAVLTIQITTTLSGPARADPSAADKETARTSMREGDEKLAAKDYAGALKAYQTAHGIMKVPTTGLAVARAQVELHQLVEARDTLLDVSRMPKDLTETNAITKARDDAAALSAKIADRIPSVNINIEGLAAGATPSVTI